PHFSSALSCAPTATGSMPTASKAIRRHAREQQEGTNAILMGFTTRRECRLDLLEQTVFQQRLFYDRNLGFSRALGGGRGRMRGDENCRYQHAPFAQLRDGLEAGHPGQVMVDYQTAALCKSFILE